MNAAVKRLVGGSSANVKWKEKIKKTKARGERKSIIYQCLGEKGKIKYRPRPKAEDRNPDWIGATSKID